MTNYKITITSDIICPWCYIGHTRLSKAISNHKSKYPDDTFELVYKPFYLSPPPPPSTSTGEEELFPPNASKPRLEMYTAKFGSARAHQIFGMLEKVARDEGLEFRFGGMTGHSRNGHRLVWYAQQVDLRMESSAGEGEKKTGTKQNETMLALWRRYFEREIDITSLQTLVDVGVECGLGSAQEIERFLKSGEGGKEVDQVAALERDEGGISGVPFYDVQGKWSVEGAQEPRAFEVLFEKWKAYEKANNSIGNGVGVVEVGGGKLC